MDKYTPFAQAVALDKVGTPIEVGYYIAYGHALGRSAGLRIGKVLAVKRVKTSHDWSPRQEWGWRITVIGVDDDWEHNPMKLCRTKGTLQFPDRMLVLYHVPAEYLELLKDYK